MADTDAYWSANYTPHTVVPPCSSILWPPCAHHVIVSHCDVVNPMLQIRRIGNRSAVALWSLMCEITADAQVSDVRHQYRSDTSYVVIWIQLKTVHRLTAARHSSCMTLTIISWQNSAATAVCWWRMCECSNSYFLTTSVGFAIYRIKSCEPRNHTRGIQQTWLCKTQNDLPCRVQNHWSATLWILPHCHSRRSISRS